jgi:hypothetical protein
MNLDFAKTQLAQLERTEAQIKFEIAEGQGKLPVLAAQIEALKSAISAATPVEPAPAQAVS